jgi:hypothetical protein
VLSRTLYVSVFLEGFRKRKRSRIRLASRTRLKTAYVNAAPPSTVNTTTRLARLRMGIAKAMVRACSVLQFYAIKTLVPICGCGDGGVTKTGRPLSNRAASSVLIREPFGV